MATKVRLTEVPAGDGLLIVETRETLIIHPPGDPKVEVAVAPDESGES